MFIYLFKIIIVFPFLFFFIFRPINKFFLNDYIVPYLNVLYVNHLKISFDYSVDNLIFKMNDTNYYYSLPFNEYYVMFFVIFLPKIFLKKYLHFHILNFTLILLAPFLYYCILYKLDNFLTLFSIVQSTVNFYFLINVIFNFLTKINPNFFRFKFRN